jgi:hypothetical protein
VGGGYFLTIVISTRRAEGKFEGRANRIKEICDRWNLNEFFKRDFKLEVGPNTVYFVLKNRMVAKGASCGLLNVSKANFVERLPTVGEEEENYVSGSSAGSEGVDVQVQDSEDV